MLVKDIMTKHVICVGPRTDISEAAQLMLGNRISGLPVINNNGLLVGIVSEGDFLRRSELGTEKSRPRWLEFLAGPGKTSEEYSRSHGRKIEEIMSDQVITTRPDAPLEEIVDVMGRLHIKRIPVVENNKLVGIVARSDLLYALARALPPTQIGNIPDAQLEASILDELSKQHWSRNASIRVRVTNGVAKLSGIIFDERERLAARVLAENIAGVKSVTDDLSWIEPMSGTVVI